MNHKHTYDKNGKQLCCNQAEQINFVENTLLTKEYEETACCTTDEHLALDEHVHSNSDNNTLNLFLPAMISLILLIIAIVLDNIFPQTWFKGWLRIAWYILAYIPVGFPVLKEAIQNIRKGELFSEFLLMSIATIGAFAIGDYAEGVAVMLFFTIV